MGDGLVFARQMPFSLEAEQSVLGSILLDPSKMGDVSGILRREDFFLSEHEEIYGVMQRMYAQDKSIDVVLLLEELVRNGTYDETGGERYIRLIAEVVPTAVNAAEYAKIVREKAVLRKIIRVGEQIAESVYSGAEDAEALIGNAEALVWGLSERHEASGFTHIRDAIMQVYRRLNDIQSNPGKAFGMPTGFGGLDKVLVGMTGGDLILVGARPGMGKTAFAMNIATEAARRSGKSVCVFSLEMSAEQLANRMISSEAQIDSVMLRSGQLGGEAGWESIAHAASGLSEMQILIDDSSDITVSGMRSKLRRVKDLGLIVVDYLQLMQSDKRSENRVLEVAEISRGLKLMAKEFDVPVICCAQLSRAVEQRADKRPMLADLRDSGAIEQDADVVMFLYRDGYYSDKPMPQSVAEVIVAKNRHGANGAVELGWIGQYMRFTDMERRR